MILERRKKSLIKIFYSVLIVSVLFSLSGTVPLFPGERSMGKIYLMPVGDISNDLILKLREPVEKTFGISVYINTGFSDIEFAYDEKRKQYYAPLILMEIRKYLSDDTLRLVGITDKDLFDKGLNFIFGEAGGSVCIVSANRFMPCTALDSDYEKNMLDVNNSSINLFDDREHNIEDLYKISNQISVNSRFYNDKHFGKSKVEELYKFWVYNSYYGKFADKIYVYNKDKSIYGFCIVQIVNNNIIRISLIGVDQTRERKGIGSIILKKVLIDYKKKGYKKCLVATQASNVNALNFYIKHNFRIYKAELVFHKWSERREE